MQILLANPRGFCAGVDRAIDIVERALELFGAPIYVRHEVVHNRFVVDNLSRAGAVFVDELDQVPDHATVIFSAHGVSKAVRRAGDKRGLRVFDATCPLVTKVHMEVTRHCKAGREAVADRACRPPRGGRDARPMVAGTPRGNQIYLVEDPADVATLKVKFPENIAYVTQTTLSVDDTMAVIDALKSKFPEISGPRHDDICYATQNRQDAVKELAGRVDLVLVVGSENSSNSNRLRELPKSRASDGYLVDGADDVRAEWLSGIRSVGVTAGASAPESLVQGVIERLRQSGGEYLEELSGKLETIEFALPKELRIALKN